jgi:hypothetical protein
MNPIRYFSWKGKTFNQITTAIQKNNVTIEGKRNLFNSNPLKIYRREIANITTVKPCTRSDVTIDELNMPNGYLVYDNANTNAGLVNILDINTTTNKYDLSTPSCNTSTNCLSKQSNALRRVRSSGMIKRKFDASRNNDTYYTSTNQYLVSRNRTFQQNQYNYIRQGDPVSKPGTSLALNNLYSANGINHCKLYYISSASNNNLFKYIWINASTEYDVNIPDGYYDLDALNNVLKNAMIENSHYFISKSTGVKFFLLNFSYNTYYNKIELQCFSRTKYSDTSLYDVPAGVSWNTNSYNNVPYFVIPSTFSSVIGFTAATYPSSPTSTEQHIIANTTSGIMPMYVHVNYKPNNPQFSQQGAVSASSLITRLKYDTITDVGGKMRTSYGSALANSLAYGVPTGGYNVKEKIGYPLTNTPIISKYTGNLIKCPYPRIKV